MSSPTNAVAWFLSAAFASLLGACQAHARASGQTVPQRQRLAVVVLGYPSFRSGRPHPVQRWRVRLALETSLAHRAELMVFSGAGRPGAPSEAAVMADLAEQIGLATNRVLLEEASIDTWQNVANSMPMVEDADCVVLVSDPLHAARARGYWLTQRPDDLGRVFVTDRCNFWDGWWLKIPTALNATKHVVRSQLRVLIGRPPNRLRP